MIDSEKDEGVPFLPSTARSLNLANVPIGSTASRVVARRLLEQRETEENDGLRFRVVDIVTGQPIDQLLLIPRSWWQPAIS